jgi:predicted nucleotidyltransferase
LDPRPLPYLDGLNGRKKLNTTNYIFLPVNTLSFHYFKKTLELLKPDLKERFKVKTIGFFGSYVRGEQKNTSDLDILVDFYETISLFRFIELEDFLSQQLGVKVDLVMRDALKPRIKDSILNEAIYV